MFNGILFSSLGLSSGGMFGNILFQLEQQGVFSFLLPFLMIFALLFGILSKINIFGQNSKPINLVLSIVVALMSLQLNFVSYFFQEIFPRMGVVLSIVLVFIVLLGLFFDFSKPGTKFFMGFLILAAVIIIVGQSLNIFTWLGSVGFGWRFNSWFQQYGTTAMILVFTAVIIFLIVKKTNPPMHDGKGKSKLFAFPGDFFEVPEGRR